MEAQKGGGYTKETEDYFFKKFPYLTPKSISDSMEKYTTLNRYRENSS